MNIQLFKWYLLVPLLTACASSDKAFFWRIEKEGRSSYVLGTARHGVEMFDLPPEIQQRFNTAKTVLLDAKRSLNVDPKKKNDFIKTITVKSKAKAETPVSKPSRSYFSESEWQEIVKRILYQHDDKINEIMIEGLTLPDISRYLRKADKIYVSYQEKKALTQAMNAELAEKAYLANKPVKFLSELQSSPACDDELTVAIIRYQLNHTTRANVDQLVEYTAAYKEADEEKILNEWPYGKKLWQCLFLEKNKVWADFINKAHSEEAPLFVAAGVSHFIGSGNIFETLTQQGFSVTRYPFAKLKE